MILSFLLLMLKGSLGFCLFVSFLIVFFCSSVSGQGSESLNENMHDGGVVPTTPGPGGPFTPSQWMEYEYQSLILKHLKRDVGLPPNLLLYIEKNFTPSGFSKSTQSLLPKQNSTPSLLSGFTPSGVPDFSAGSSRSNSCKLPCL